MSRSKKRRLRNSKEKLKKNLSKQLLQRSIIETSTKLPNVFSKFKDPLKGKSPSKLNQSRKRKLSKSMSLLSKKAKPNVDVIDLDSNDELDETEIDFNATQEALNSTQKPMDKNSSFYEDKRPGVDPREIPTYSEISSQENFVDDSVIFVSEQKSDLEEGEIVTDNDTDSVIVVEDTLVYDNDIIDLDLEATIRPSVSAPDYIPLPKSTRQPPLVKTLKKRMIVIDGSNVAYGHSNRKVFSVRGIKICIDYFKAMGHEVTAVIPQYRMRKNMTNNQKLLEDLEADGVITLTPCKNLPGNRSSSYDDRFILQIADKMGGVVISNDNYRDLLHENPMFKEIIENRVVGYSWVKDLLIIPEDPYGRNGPKLKDILHVK